MQISEEGFLNLWTVPGRSVEIPVPLPPLLRFSVAGRMGDMAVQYPGAREYDLVILIPGLLFIMDYWPDTVTGLSAVLRRWEASKNLAKVLD